MIGLRATVTTMREFRHVLLSVKNDTELDKLLQGVMMEGGGVLPRINPAAP